MKFIFNEEIVATFGNKTVATASQMLEICKLINWWLNARLQ